MKKTFDIRMLDKAALNASFNPPEGYLDEVKRRVMAQLPPAESPEWGKSAPLHPHTFRRTLKIITGVAAAVACVAVAWIWPSDNAADSPQPVPSTPAMAASQYDSNDEYVDDVYNYAMLDNYDFYDYLYTDF